MSRRGRGNGDEDKIILLFAGEENGKGCLIFNAQEVYPRASLSGASIKSKGEGEISIFLFFGENEEEERSYIKLV